MAFQVEGPAWAVTQRTHRDCKHRRDERRKGRPQVARSGLMAKSPGSVGQHPPPRVIHSWGGAWWLSKVGMADGKRNRQKEGRRELRLVASKGGRYPGVSEEPTLPLGFLGPTV